MTTEEKKLIGMFLGWEVITYKGQDTFDGHKTCKNIGEKINRFGKNLSFTGCFVKDIEYPFETDWGFLMILVKECFDRQPPEKPHMYFKHIKEIQDSLLTINRISTYEACIEFIRWYNNK
jgi:hypothetical protein